MAEEKKAPAATSKKLVPLDEVKANLNKMGPEFAKLLPPQISMDKFVRVVITAVTNEPKLIDCVRSTLFSACLKAAGQGLLPDGREGAIVPYYEKGGLRAVWQPMIQGFFKLTRQGGVTSPFAEVVHENDEFEFFTDINGRHLKHVPNLSMKDRGEPVLAYAFAKVDGETEIEVMLKEDILKVRDFSKAKNGPWQSEFVEEMWKKTVYRRLAKRLPQGLELEQAIQDDDEENFDFNRAKIAEPSQESLPGKPGRLKSLIAGQQQPSVIVETPAEEIKPIPTKADDWPEPTAEEKAAQAVDNL